MWAWPVNPPSCLTSLDVATGGPGVLRLTFIIPTFYTVPDGVQGWNTFNSSLDYFEFLLNINFNIAPKILCKHNTWFGRSTDVYLSSNKSYLFHVLDPDRDLAAPRCEIDSKLSRSWDGPVPLKMARCSVRRSTLWYRSFSRLPERPSSCESKLQHSSETRGYRESFILL